MGIRVNKETLVKQLEMSNLTHYLEMPYHQAIMNDEIPLSIGGGIGSRACKCSCSKRRILARYR